MVEPVGRRHASPTAATNSTQHLVPRDTNRPLGIQLVEASIELGPLGRSEGKSFRYSRETVPQFLEQAEPFLSDAISRSRLPMPKV